VGSSALSRWLFLARWAAVPLLARSHRRRSHFWDKIFDLVEHVVTCTLAGDELLLLRLREAQLTALSVHQLDAQLEHAGVHGALRGGRD
jgi:hypothetical protein